MHTLHEKYTSPTNPPPATPNKELMTATPAAEPVIAADPPITVPNPAPISGAANPCLLYTSRCV